MLHQNCGLLTLYQLIKLCKHLSKDDIGVSNSFNPFPNKPLFLRVCSTSLLNTLREKEKLLITSSFFFSHSVFYPFRELSAIFIKLVIVVCKLFQFGESKIGFFGKGLKHMSCKFKL